MSVQAINLAMAKTWVFLKFIYFRYITNSNIAAITKVLENLSFEIGLLITFMIFSFTFADWISSLISICMETTWSFSAWIELTIDQWIWVARDAICSECVRLLMNIFLIWIICRVPMAKLQQMLDDVARMLCTVYGSLDRLVSLDFFCLLIGTMWGMIKMF